jgi:hypothetical protein
MTVHDAYRAFKAADEAWSNDLFLAFGKDAGDKRYTAEGKNHPYCVSSYQDFKRAGEQWRALMVSNGRTV